MHQHDHEDRGADEVERVSRPSRPRPARRRRAVRGGALLAGAVVIVGVATGCGAGDETADDIAADAPAGTDDAPPSTSGATGEGSIAVTDASGTERVFAADELAVGCTGEGDEQRIVLSRADLLPGVLAGEPPAPDTLDDGPFPLIQIDVERVPLGEELTLPLDDTLDEAVILFFVVDDGGPRANELSSDRPDASGTLMVEEASCDSEPRLELTVDALLGSEVNQGSLPMAGTYRFG